MVKVINILRCDKHNCCNMRRIFLVGEDETISYYMLCLCLKNIAISVFFHLIGILYFNENGYLSCKK